MSKIKIIIAGEKYNNQIKLIGRKTWLATYPNEKPKILKKDILDFWRKRKKIKRKTLYPGDIKKWVAFYNDKIVGYCIAERKEKFNEVRAIYILPRYQRLGIGKIFFHKALKYLDEGKDIKISVVSYNKQAIAFYENFGFKKDKRLKTWKIDLLNGKHLPVIQLVRRFKK